VGTIATRNHLPRQSVSQCRIDGQLQRESRQRNWACRIGAREMYIFLPIESVFSCSRTTCSQETHFLFMELNLSGLKMSGSTKCS